MKASVEGRTNVVIAADLPEEEWLELRREHKAVRRRIARPLCSCVDCEHPLHPKQNSRGTRFFAHNPEAPETCPLKVSDGESPEHQRMKLSIYRAAKRVAGWDADVEVKAPDADPVTGRPVIVDVVARRRDGLAREWTPPVQGWEVQLTRTHEGDLLDRQEQRDRWLGRCTWITTERTPWAPLVPWYQVTLETREHPDLVVDGVNRWEQYDEAGRGGRYVQEDPFPADSMVGFILRGARWTDIAGWELQFAAGAPQKGPRRSRRESVRGAVAEYCDRMLALPEFARGWTDADWLRYAPVAHDRRRRGESLTVTSTGVVYERVRPFPPGR